MTNEYWSEMVGHVRERLVALHRDPNVVLDEQRERRTLRLLLDGSAVAGDYSTFTLSSRADDLFAPNEAAEEIIQAWMTRWAPPDA